MGFSLLLVLCCELGLVWALSLNKLQLLPPPNIFLDPPFPVQRLGQATFDCVGAYSSQEYYLVREGLGRGQIVKAVKALWDGRVGRFVLENVTEEMAGPYTCIYFFSQYYSKNSEPLPLIIRAIPESPFLWASPSATPSFRQSVTFHCNSSEGLDAYRLYHGSMEDGNPFIEPLNVSAQEGLFYYREMHRHQLGQYLCVSYRSWQPYVWSNISNVVVITAGAPPPAFTSWPHLIPVALTMAALGEQLA